MPPNVTCPEGYTCKFTKVKEPFEGPWWEGAWGIVVAIGGIIAVTIILLTVAYYYKEHRDNIRRSKDLERERSNALAIEEQRTMQLDAAKGDKEMLKIVRALESKR